MLILSRKIEEAIIIGDSITIKILGIHDGQVKIGIEAPKEIKVYRSELYDLIQKENVQASKSKKVSISKTAMVLRTANVVQRNSPK
jgi:carbon storage regulator